MLWGTFCVVLGSWKRALLEDNVVFAAADFGVVASEIRNAQGGPLSVGAQTAPIIGTTVMPVPSSLNTRVIQARGSF